MEQEPRDPVILYQSALSTYSLKVRLALAVKGARLELREPPGGSYRSDAYRAMVRPATVPALVDGDFVLTESDAIIEYVDERFPGPRLLPAEAKERARARMLSRLVDFRLEAGIRKLFPAVKEGRRIGPPELEAAEQALSLVCDMAQPAGPWGCGQDPSLADFGLVSAMVWMDLLRAADPARAAKKAEPARLVAWRSAWNAEDRFQPLLSAYRDLARSWLSGFRAATSC